MWNDDENILRFSREGNLREVSAGPVAVASNGTVVKRRPEDAVRNVNQPVGQGVEL